MTIPSASARWRVLVVRASDNLVLEELPARDCSITEAISTDGVFTCSLPTFERSSRRSLLDPHNGREIAVIRDPDSPSARCVFAGPIVSTARSLAEQSVQVTARSPFWYLSRTYTEVARNYTLEPFDIVRDLVAMVDAKASLPGHSTDTWASGYGPTSLAFSEAERRNIGRLIDELASDDAKPWEWRYDYTWTPSTMSLGRKLRLKAPYLGSDKSASFTLTEQNGLLSFTETSEILRAAKRVHVLGAGEGLSRLRVTRQTTIATQVRPLEYLAEADGVDSSDLLFGLAGGYLRALRPPVRIITASFRPSLALPYDFYNLGDWFRVTVPLGYETYDEVRRVVAMTTRWDEDGEESVDLVFNDPAAVSGGV